MGVKCAAAGLLACGRRVGFGATGGAHVPAAETAISLHDDFHTLKTDSLQAVHCSAAMVQAGACARNAMLAGVGKPIMAILQFCMHHNLFQHDEVT